jgi:preprotein translocase subunit Sec63
MTDPVARENFLKFGSPDGYGNFHVSIALPHFLEQKEHQLLVLLAFFILIVGVIPYYFYTQLSQEEKDVGGVNMENRKIFTELIDQNMMGQKIPGILGQGVEFKKMDETKEEQIIKKMCELPEISQCIPKQEEMKEGV